MRKRALQGIFFIGLLLGLLVPDLTLAQDSENPKTTIQIEGVSGYMDRDGRDPLLTVSTEVSESGTKILADATVPNETFKTYPIRYEFYVNGQLYTTQVRSPELPRPVGIDVSKQKAPLPFNFTVVAQVLYPNRTFTTVHQGAVFANDLVTTFSCTLTEKNSDQTTDSVFTAADVSTEQAGNNTLSLKFEASEQTSGQNVEVSATVKVVDSAATATVTITGDDTQTVEATGTATTENGELKELSVASEDENTTLKCS